MADAVRGAGVAFAGMADAVRGAVDFRRVAVDFRGAAVGYFRVARGADFVPEAVVALLVRLALKLAVARGFQLAGFRGLVAAGGVRAFRGWAVLHVPAQVYCVGFAVEKA